MLRENTILTQKSIKLIQMAVKIYPKEGDLILDTHLGSGSIAIACHDYKFDLTGCEIDSRLPNAGCKAASKPRGSNCIVLTKSQIDERGT